MCTGVRVGVVDSSATDEQFRVSAVLDYGLIVQVRQHFNEVLHCALVGGEQSTSVGDCGV